MSIFNKIVFQFFILTTLTATANQEYNKVIYMVPPEGYYGDKIFDMDDPYYNCDDRARPFFNLRKYLRKYSYDLRTTTLNEDLQNFEGLIVFPKINNLDKLNKLSKLPKEKLILALLEPPTVAIEYYDPNYHKHFGKVLIMLDNYVDNQKYFKLFFPQTSLKMLDNSINFNNKKFCTLIASNKFSSHPLELYSQRIKTAKFFEKKSDTDFDLYGNGWNINLFPSYKGRLNLKRNKLNEYKFCICYENMKNVNGYITEKIFDAFISGCIPVYWGADNITDFIPSNCFIDRRNFKNSNELYNYLRLITKKQHKKYINNIKKFLESPQAFKFSQYYFIDQVLSMFIDNYNKKYS